MADCAHTWTTTGRCQKCGKVSDPPMPSATPPAGAGEAVAWQADVSGVDAAGYRLPGRATRRRQIEAMLPKPATYPKPDENGNDTGPCCAHAYADGWNACRAATAAKINDAALATPTPLPEAVRELPGKWRAIARGLRALNDDKAAEATEECADELSRTITGEQA